MAREKEYQEIVSDEAEKLKDALMKKKRREEAVSSAFENAATAIVGGPILVVILMALSLAACTFDPSDLAAFVQ